MKITKTCPHCNGVGDIEQDVCISDWHVSATHKNADLLGAIVQDALKAKSDHAKLCSMNARAKDSYDAQLASTLEKLEAEALELLK